MERGFKILVVDDSQLMRAMIRKTIRKAGYSTEEYPVREADGVEEAMRQVREFRPRVVLTDWHMEDGSGLELIQKIRGEGFNCRFGVITSERTDKARLMALKEGARVLVAKPFTTDTIRTALGSLIASSDVLPTPDAVADMLGMLLGVNGKAVRTSPLLTESPECVALASYVTEESRYTTHAIADVQFVCIAQSVLSGQNVADLYGSLVLGKFPRDLQENLHEVFNVMTSLFNIAGRSAHVLDSVHWHESAFPEKEEAAARRATNRLHLQLDLGSMGSGRISLMASDSPKKVAIG